MPAPETEAAIDQLIALARHLHRLVQDAECRDAQELGLHPQLAVVPEPGEDQHERIAYVRAILQDLADGRTALLQRVRSLSRELTTARQERESALREGPRPSASPRDALRQRINQLIRGLDGEVPPPPIRADESQDVLTARLRQMEQEAEHRQMLVEKLIQKAFEQGELIGDLRERLDRINAMASSVYDDNGHDADHGQHGGDDFLVIPDDGAEDDEDQHPY